MGLEQETWSIYAIDLNSGNTISVIPPVQGLQIGYPSISNTNDFRLTFDVLDSSSGLDSVYAADFNKGTLNAIASNLQDWASPAYTADDSAVLFSVVDASTTGFSIWSQPIGADGITPIGAATLHISDADFAGPYRRGSFNPSARIDLSVVGQISSQIQRGLQSSFSYTVRNNGASVATGVNVTSTVPNSLNVDIGGASVQGVSCRPSAQQLSCVLPDMQPGDQADLTINFTPQIAGPLSIGISGNGDQTDSNASDNTAFLSTNVIAVSPTITSIAPPGGTVGVVYSFKYAATGTAPMVYTITAGALPPGLTLSAAGAITGTPTAAGTYTGTVTVSNGAAPDATQSFSIVVLDQVVVNGGGGGGGGGGGSFDGPTLLAMLLALLLIGAGRRRAQAQR